MPTAGPIPARASRQRRDLRVARRILIAGCGDLGQRLARRLLARGDTVFGLRRDPSCLLSGIVPVAADLLDPASLPPLPRDLDAVVVTLTPARRDEDGYRAIYLQAPAALRCALGTQAPSRWLFASSTAVYAGDDGRLIDDSTPPAPEAFNGRVLLEAEQALLEQAPRSLALRFGGIYGPGRTRLIERVRSGAPARPRWGNRIHSEDAAAALAFALDTPELCGAAIATDGAPARDDEVAAFIADRLGLPAPRCQIEAESGRRILPTRLQAAGFEPAFLSYRLGYSSLLQDSDPSAIVP
jgi:nucleoside-diphosphate-sugar epimerase